MKARKALRATVVAAALTATMPLVARAGDLTLDDYFAAALRRSEVVASQAELIRQAEERYVQAKAAVRPRVDGVGAYTRTDTGARDASDFPTRQTLARLTATQPLFRGFREFAAIRQSQALIGAQTEDYLNARVQLFRDVVQNFYEVLALEQDLRNYAEQIGQNREREKELQGRVRIGRSRIGEVLTVQSTISTLRARVEQLVAFLWDIGLEVGHSVRTVAECAEESAADVGVMTTLLEARQLAGSVELVGAMRRALAPEHVWPVRAFFEAKVREQQERHLKANDTAYNLEPNVKTGPGGLRDIQTIAWVAKRHFGAESLDELVTHGFLTPSELRRLKQAQAFLWKVRFGLHTLAGRHEDRLLFDHQIKLAQTFGYEDASYTLAVEQLKALAEAAFAHRRKRLPNSLELAGLAFELIKWFGKNRTKRWARALMWPGMQLQRLTTRDPDLSQLAVAIAALEAVLAVENPRAASEEDMVGMEVVA